MCASYPGSGGTPKLSWCVPFRGMGVFFGWLLAIHRLWPIRPPACCCFSLFVCVCVSCLLVWVWVCVGVRRGLGVLTEDLNINAQNTRASHCDNMPDAVHYAFQELKAGCIAAMAKLADPTIFQIRLTCQFMKGSCLSGRRREQPETFALLDCATPDQAVCKSHRVDASPLLRRPIRAVLGLWGLRCLLWSGLRSTLIMESFSKPSRLR